MTSVITKLSKRAETIEMKIGPTRKERAAEIRDVMLPSLLRYGHLVEREQSRHQGRFHEFRFVYRTAFGKLLREPRPRAVLEAILHQQNGRRKLPFGLDIWYMEPKVLNVEWDDAGLIHVVYFHRGSWEDELLQRMSSHRTSMKS